MSTEPQLLLGTYRALQEKGKAGPARLSAHHLVTHAVVVWMTVGVGVVVATQNPMDLDYRALGNAGIWLVGRLQTDADRERVLEGLSGAGHAHDGPTKAELAHTVKRLAPRWFVMRDVHASEGTVLLQARWAISLLMGPMTRTEIRRALGKEEAVAETAKHECDPSGAREAVVEKDEET